MTGATPGFTAGLAGSLPAHIGEMQTIVADQTRPPISQSPVAGWRLDHADGRMPVDVDDPFALAPFDQHIVAMHGGEEYQPLYPIDARPQSVIVA